MTENIVIIIYGLSCYFIGIITHIFYLKSKNRRLTNDNTK